VLTQLPGAGQGTADAPVLGFGDGTGGGGAFGGEAVFHLGEQRQQQEGAPAAARAMPRMISPSMAT